MAYVLSKAVYTWKYTSTRLLLPQTGICHEICLKPASLRSNCYPLWTLSVLYFQHLSSHSVCILLSSDHLPPVFPGGAGASQPGQWNDQQAGAAAGCEEVVCVAVTMFVHWKAVHLSYCQSPSFHTVSWQGSLNVICDFMSCVRSLQDARSSYRRILTDSARKLNAQGSQLGPCIEKARPYYEARRLAKEVGVVAAQIFSVCEGMSVRDVLSVSSLISPPSVKWGKLHRSSCNKSFMKFIIFSFCSSCLKELLIQPEGHTGSWSAVELCCFTFRNVSHV